MFKHMIITTTITNIYTQLYVVQCSAPSVVVWRRAVRRRGEAATDPPQHTGRGRQWREGGSVHCRMTEPEPTALQPPDCS